MSGLRRQNRFSKKPADSEQPKNGISGAMGNKENSGVTQVMLHSQDEKKMPPVMLDPTIFGAFEDGKVFCLTLKDRSQKLYFMKKPECFTKESIFREASISCGGKYLSEQGIASWPKTIEAEWVVLDDEARRAIAADTVIFLFKNQYFSMRDIYHAVNKMNDELLVANSNLRVEGLDFKVQQIIKDGVQTRSGIFLSGVTKHVFCSQSAKVFVLLEVAKETFMLSSKKNVKLEDYFMFLKNYFESMDSGNCNHDINIVFYAKIYFPCFHNINDLYLKYLTKETPES